MALSKESLYSQHSGNSEEGGRIFVGQEDSREDLNRRLARVVRTVREGQVTAFDEIVQTFEAGIRSYVAARCPPEVDPDDISQEVFIIAFRKLDQFTIGTDFKAWIYAIARFEVMRERKRLKQRFLSWQRFSQDWLPEAGGDEEECSEDHVYTALGDCLANLDNPGYHLIDKRYRKAYSIRDLAREFGRSEGAIKKHLHVLRRRLHECINQRLRIR